MKSNNNKNKKEETDAVSRDEDPSHNNKEHKAVQDTIKMRLNVLIICLLVLALIGLIHHHIQIASSSSSSKQRYGRKDIVLPASIVHTKGNTPQPESSQNLQVPSSIRKLKVPYPIFVASFSKSGTTSTYSAFACYLGKEHVAHRWTTSSLKNGKPEFIGHCIEQNIARQVPPFEGCGTNQHNQTQTVVWTDTAYAGSNSGCYHPNLQALDAVWDAYPTATLLLIRRNATAWYQSAHSKRASFIQSWANSCSIMPNTTDEKEWVDFYNNHTEKVRAFAKSRQPLGLTYVEVELESPDTGNILEEQVGIPKSCWKHCLSSFTQEECKDLQQQQQQHKKKNGRRLLRGPFQSINTAHVLF